MPSISFYSILALCVIAMSLGLVTLANNPRQYANRVFAALSSFAGAYSLVNYLADYDQVRSLFWVRGTFVLATILVMLMLLFLGSFPKLVVSNRSKTLITLASIVVAGITCLPSFIPDVILLPGSAQVISGPLYPAFVVYLAMGLIGAIALIVYQLRHSSDLDRERIKYVAIGLVLTALLISSTNLVLPLLVGNNNLAELGSYFILIFVVFTAFAIVRHRLFDLRFVIARSITYTLLLATLAAGYSVAAFSVSNIFFPGDSASKGQLIFNTAIALILAFTFQPLRRFFERITDRVFYREHYDSQEVLNDFSKILVRELNLDRILKHTLENLCEAVHIQFAQLVIFNRDRVYRVEHYGPLPQRLMVAPELHTLNRSIIVADELEGGARKTLMDRHSIRVSMMLTSREEFVGYLLLGDKLSGDIYSDQDIELLEIIAKELAVAIQNAKAYAQIQEFNINLQARIEHATNRLRVANRHLKELDRAKDEFISMASHQLRTPLTTIKGYLSMMLEGDAGPVSDNQRQFVQFAFDASERMVNLISDLLNVSRLSAGRFLIQTKPTDMVKMIEEEVHQLEQHAAAKHIGLVFERPKVPLPPAQIDDNKTRQVVMNFIDNAIYYTTHGQVTVKLKQTGNAVRLEVIDTGIGVPDDARKKLFTKFYRASNAQTVRPDGTGLGLYLAKRVIQDQGGTIIFSSVEGKGSTFGFELPLKPSSVKHEEPHGHEPVRK